MDLVYMPEVLPYSGILRPPIAYRDYEQPWNHDYFHLGKSNTTRYQQEQYQQQLRASREKDHCELCRNNKRRSLAAYIRNKSKSDSCNEIHEEEEESIDNNTTNNNGNKINTVMTSMTTETTTAAATTKAAAALKNDENQCKPSTKTSRFSFRFKTAK